MKEAKELNLCEILKNCPKGIILYSTDYGYLEFCFVDDTEDFPIILKTQNNNDVAYLSDGRKTKYNGAECCLFPSKDNRDWSTWESPKTKVERFDPKTFKPFDKVDYKEIDWEQRRYEIAKNMLAAFLSNSCQNIYAGHPDLQAKDAVKYADALIEELKK